MNDKVTAIHDKMRGAFPSTTGDGGGTYVRMEARVSKLEGDMTDIKVSLATIGQRLESMEKHVSTRADISEAERRISERIGSVEARVGRAEGELSRTLGVWQFLAIMIAAVGIIVKWPAISAALGI